MVEERDNYVGQISEPGLKPRNVELTILKRGNKSKTEAAAGIQYINPRYDELDPARYGAKGDGETDDTAAVQDAADVAEQGDTIAELDDRYYKLSSPILYNRGDCGLRNGTLVADDTAVWDDTKAMVRMNTGLRFKMHNIDFECEGVANGWIIESGGFASKISGCETNAYYAFGCRLESGVGSDVKISDCIFTQGTSAGGVRTGIGMDILCGDTKLFHNVSRYALNCLHISGNTAMVVGNHFYNGGDTSTRDPINVLIDGGSGCNFTGNYIDKGIIKLDGSYSHSFIDNKFLYGTPGAMDPDGMCDSAFIIAANQASQPFPDGLIIGPNRVPTPIISEAMQYINFTTSGGTGWAFTAADIENFIDRANVIIGGDPFVFCNPNGASISERVPSSATATANREKVWELSSNTTLTVKVRGTDGTVRSGTIALS